MEVWMTPLGKPRKKINEPAPIEIPQEWPETVPVDPVRVPDKEPVLVP